MNDFDVIISGAGMVGSLLAVALGKAQLRVLVLESRLPEPFVAESDYDLRVSALSVASQKMLQVLGAWEGITSRRSAPFSRMKVWDGEQGGTTLFEAGDLGGQGVADANTDTDDKQLGTIVENRVIQLALHDVLQQLHTVELRAPASLKSFDARPDCAVVELADSSTVSAKLLVGADGARSQVRELAGIAMEQSRYPQEALVATVTTESPQQDITWQRFMPTGPQALLPLQGQRASMVWYHSADEVQRLKSLPDAEFLGAMQAAFPDETGKLTGICGRGSFPLFRSHAERYVSDRVALVGDAAHTVHPLAGQGVNLGLLDAAVLAEVILGGGKKPATNHGKHLGKPRLSKSRDFGKLPALRPYQRWRRSENTLMIGVLDGFYHAFTPHAQPVQKIRSVAMATAGRVKPLRRLIMQHAIGVSGDLPLLARGQALPGFLP